MAKKNTDHEIVPWVEKYRPMSLDEVASQTYTIESLKKFVERETLPHMIFTGPAGTGKTSAAKALIFDLIGKENMTQDIILERNASDECRMKNLPEIKNFVSHTGVNQTPFKFVVLDEADNLSKDVQSAFRRVIELAPPNVKFIFMCNYVENIIGPILSRCAIFRFYPLPKEDFTKQIKKIAKKEEINLTNELINVIFYISNGDMRKAINLLQIVYAYVEEEIEGEEQKEIDKDVVYKISGYLPVKKLNSIFTKISQKELIGAIHLIEDIKGLSSRALFRQIMDKIIEEGYDFPLFDRLLVAIAEYDYRLTLEANPRIQIDGMIADLIYQLRSAH